MEGLEEYYSDLQHTIEEVQDSLTILEEAIIQDQPCKLWVKRYREVSSSVKSVISLRVLGLQDYCTGREDLFAILTEYLDKLLDIHKTSTNPEHKVTGWFEWIDAYYDFVWKILTEVDKDRYSIEEARGLVKGFEIRFRLNNKWAELCDESP